jgi:hypothetical protein
MKHIIKFSLNPKISGPMLSAFEELLHAPIFSRLVVFPFFSSVHGFSFMKLDEFRRGDSKCVKIRARKQCIDTEPAVPEPLDQAAKFLSSSPQYGQN